jgi:hypothetical protein
MQNAKSNPLNEFNFWKEHKYPPFGLLIGQTLRVMSSNIKSKKVKTFFEPKTLLLQM